MKYQDEFSYLIQTQMLSHGTLFMPPHPCPEFSDSVYLLAKPVYASMYFPGAALMYVWALWVHLPYYAGPLAASGLAAGTFYLVISEILDGASGLLAVLLLLSLERFRQLSIMIMSQPPALFLGMLMTFAWLRCAHQSPLGLGGLGRRCRRMGRHHSPRRRTDLCGCLDRRDCSRLL